jgi:hypothetical protein
MMNHGNNTSADKQPFPFRHLVYPPSVCRTPAERLQRCASRTRVCQPFNRHPPAPRLIHKVPYAGGRRSRFAWLHDTLPDLSVAKHFRARIVNARTWSAHGLLPACRSRRPGHRARGGPNICSELTLRPQRPPLRDIAAARRASLDSTSIAAGPHVSTVAQGEQLDHSILVSNAVLGKRKSQGLFPFGHGSGEDDLLSGLPNRGASCRIAPADPSGFGSTVEDLCG